MFYLLANEKFVKYTRIGIYAAGVFLLGLFFYINVFQIEINSYIIKNDGSFPMPNFYELPSDHPASEIKMELNFKEADVNAEKLQVFVTRAHSALFRKRNQMIFEPEKLKELIYKDALPDYPSGTLLKKNNTFFLVYENKIRPFLSDKIINQFGFDKSRAKEVSQETLDQFEMDDPIDKNSFSEEFFPSGIIIKVGRSYFFTGSKRIYPIFSEDVIKQAWPDFYYIESGPTRESSMDTLDCFINGEKKIICQKRHPAEGFPGSEYALSIQGITLEKIDSVKIQKLFFPSWKYIQTRLRELFW